MNFTRKDILTPANAITLAGLLICLVGCVFLNTVGGLAAVLIGRSFDLIDGPVARATHTSEFSKYFDPTADKIALLAILISSTYFKLIPILVILYIFAQNILVAGLSVKAQRKKVAVGAVIPGKLNIFFQILAIFLFIVSVVIHGSSQLTELLAWISLIISFPFAVWATAYYARLISNSR